jgi:hypothetical protein
MFGFSPCSCARDGMMLLVLPEGLGSAIVKIDLNIILYFQGLPDTFFIRNKNAAAAAVAVVIILLLHHD